MALETGVFPDDVKELASTWGGCPTFEVVSPAIRPYVAITPLRPDPALMRLHDLGEAFTQAIRTDDPHEARRLLDAIQAED